MCLKVQEYRIFELRAHCHITLIRTFHTSVRNMIYLCTRYHASRYTLECMIPPITKTALVSEITPAPITRVSLLDIVPGSVMSGEGP